MSGPGRVARVAAFVLSLAACHQAEPGGSRAPPPASSAEPIAQPLAATAAPAGALAGEEETLHFTGTEPFWGGQVAGRRLTYSTPEKPSGTVIEVTRAASADSLAFSGMLDGQPLALEIARTPCSDGMSDRSYPFTATLRLGGELRHGCAWSEAHPFAPPGRP